VHGLRVTSHGIGRPSNSVLRLFCWRHRHFSSKLEWFPALVPPLLSCQKKNNPTIHKLGNPKLIGVNIDSQFFESPAILLGKNECPREHFTNN
jgi:hypothetical protein